MGIFLANSQSLWLQLQPQSVGKFALKATANDVESGELVSSYQTTISVKRDLMVFIRIILGLGSIIAGPMLSIGRFLFEGI
ncbi:MAG: hypothetical protein ACXAC7_24690 [Candidatus Hodarchaeales archaeon]|jgi:hypothetical protein